MKKIQNSVALALVALALASCSVTLPLEVTNNPIGSKVGSSVTNTIFGWWAAGGAGFGGYNNKLSSTGWRFNKEYSLYDAAKKGGISKVATVDLKVTNYVLFKKYELIVTGQ